MRTDAELLADLVERIDAIPSIDSTDIVVHVDKGMVTLNGHVDTHQTRFRVERTARCVAGIRGLQINIKPTRSMARR